MPEEIEKITYTSARFQMTDELKRALKMRQAKLGILLPEALTRALHDWAAEELAIIRAHDAAAVAP